MIRSRFMTPGGARHKKPEAPQKDLIRKFYDSGSREEKNDRI
jgi:hypothetical protein